MRNLVLLSTALFATACSDTLLDNQAVRQLGNQMCSIGHPNAECGEGKVAGRSHGPLSLSKTKERWIDIAVPYTRKDKEHEMTIRVHVKELVPCNVTTNVVADDGPNPILLDNAVSSKLVGDAICKEIGAK